MKPLQFDTPFMAVFNQHVNQAGLKAFQDCNNMYAAKGRGMLALTKARREGIMVLFENKPIGPEREYIIRVFAYANGIDLIEARKLYRAGEAHARQLETT